jgi:hypothetical protein
MFSDGRSVHSVSKDLVGFKGSGRFQRILSDLSGFLSLDLSFALGLLLLDNTKMQTLSRLP